ncbi:MAG: hypothetical protein IPK83_18600 [Planctomycetes bacterium]|nr:hypothetical protein [Planctomycetota bacterium]
MLTVYDIETDGFGSTCRLACAVSLVLPEWRLNVYGQSRIGQMFTKLNAANLRTGFNTVCFDDPIIQRLANRQFTSPSWDLLAEIKAVNDNSSGGWSQDAITKAMLGESSFLTGDQIPALFRAGKFHDIIEHCIQDVCGYARLLKEIIRRGGVVTNGIKTVKVDISVLRRHFVMPLEQQV